MILQLSPTIDVSTPLGDCEAFFIIDCGINTNTIWVARMPGGEVKHFWSDDVRIYGNPMNGKGWDVDSEGDNFRKTFIDSMSSFAKRHNPTEKMNSDKQNVVPEKESVNKIPIDARRNMDFLKNT